MSFNLFQIKLYEKQIALQLCPDYHTIKLILDEIMLVADGMFDKYEVVFKRFRIIHLVFVFPCYSNLTIIITATLYCFSAYWFIRKSILNL